MKATKKNLLHKVLVSFFAYLVAAASAFGQEISYTTIEPTLNAKCIDYPPIGDGFGWNGRCGCMVEPEWFRFGGNVTVWGNTIAISAADTPENCPGSDATVSIYEKLQSGDWVKHDEFNLDAADDPGISGLNFIDGKLEVESGIYRSRIFEKLEGKWQLTSTLEGSTGPFVRRDWTERGRSDDATLRRLFELTFGDVDLDGNETVQSQVELEVEGTRSLLVSRYNDIAVGKTWDEVFFFSEDSTGSWQLDSRIPFYTQDTTDSMIVFQGSIIVLDRVDNMHRWIRDQDGVWVKSEVFVTDLPYPYSYLDTVPFKSDNKLLLSALGHFRTYMLNSENKLVETDRLELSVERGGQWGGIWGSGDSIPLVKSQVDFDGAHLLTGINYENIAYVFDVSSNGVIGDVNDEDASEGECSYINADIYDGWGWNASSGISCPPVDVDNESLYNNVACIDTDGDGWGWQNPDNAPGRSCAVEESSNDACIDSDGDGYGWDGVKTCIPDSSSDTTQCLDTDGDGYGWDGTKSCIP